MPRYIDFDDLGIGKAKREVFEDPKYADGWNAAIEILEKAPTADVEKVVYCKDCKNFIKYSSGNICEEYGGYVKGNDFCSRCPDRVAKMDQEGEGEK